MYIRGFFDLEDMLRLHPIRITSFGMTFWVSAQVHLLNSIRGSTKA